MGNGESRFVPASAEKLKEALGPITGESNSTKKALSDIPKFWQNIKVRDLSDWQECYPKDGWAPYPKFGGKIMK